MNEKTMQELVRAELIKVCFGRKYRSQADSLIIEECEEMRHSMVKPSTHRVVYRIAKGDLKTVYVYEIPAYDKSKRSFVIRSSFNPFRGEDVGNFSIDK